MSLGGGRLLSASKRNQAASVDYKDSDKSRNSRFLGSSTQIMHFSFLQMRDEEGVFKRKNIIDKA